MKQRRKNIKEKDVRTILSIIDSYKEQNKYMWCEMNKHMGSMTINEMLELERKLLKWYNEDEYLRRYEEP